MIEGKYAKKQILCQNKIIAWSHSSRFKTVHNLLEKYADSNSNLLDYGCGDGTFLTMVGNLFPKAVGTDIAPDQISDCQKRLSQLLPKVYFCNMDEIDSEKYNSYFDIAVCMEVLEHCVPNSVEQVITDLKRLVKPRGIIIISVPIEIGLSLLIKQVTRRIAGWLRQGDYAQSIEAYTSDEFLKMVFATESTAIERPIWGDFPCHGHKGFNWRSLRHKLSENFEIEHTLFSPLGRLGGYVSSQVFLICRNG